MPRNVSLIALRSALAQQTEEVWLNLIDVVITGTTHRFVNNTEAVVSLGNTYSPFNFEFNLPNDEADREPGAQLTISNVSQQIIDDIRANTGVVTITLRVILASTPNVTEYGPILMQVIACTYNAEAITFTLSFEAFAGEPLGHINFTPEYFPGMFV